MKDFLSKLLSEAGAISTTRVVVFISLIMGFIIAIIGLCTNKDLGALSILVTAFIGPALTNKAISKFAETKEDKPDA
jgi:hypothetical protein